MKKYSDEHRRFFLSFIPGHTCVEVAQEFNRRFDIMVTPSQVKSYKNNCHIKSGTFKGKPAGDSRLFPKNVRDFIRANNTGKTALQMTNLLNDTFCTNYTVGQIKRIRNSMHLNSGLTGRFEKGHVPPNKGKRGVCGKGCEKTWFKKGQMPHNHVPVGTEVMTTDGYLKIKIAEPKLWKHKHIIEWEKHYGKVPEGCIISFKDGNKCNCVVENLFCITKAENAILNHQGLRSASPELTESGLVLAKVQHKLSLLKKKTKQHGETNT